MICYKDRTWCQESTCLKFGVDCDRALTEDVKKANTTNLPYSIWTERPSCYQSKAEIKPNFFREL